MLKNIYSFKNSIIRNKYTSSIYFSQLNFFSNLNTEHKKHIPNIKIIINITNEKNKITPSKIIEITEKILPNKELHYERRFNDYIDGNTYY